MKTTPCLTHLTPAHLAIWQLIRTTGVGPVAFKRLLKLCNHNPLNATEQFSELAAARGRKAKLCPMSDIEAEAEALYKAGGQAVFLGDDAYPTLLSHIPDCPPMLHIIGNLETLNMNSYAIVGSRNASAVGMKFAEELATDLTLNGATITSGLARGIDTAAHTGELQNGFTLAVVAGGVNHIYPPENKNLREKIIAEGCVISENPFGSTPTNRHFPRRNRIIAGLTRATVVVEATRKSGSLITATFAGEYGRDVYAVPGAPADPRATGSNHLLKQVAQLLESAEDILQNTPLQNSFTPQPKTVYVGEDFTPNLFETATEETSEPTEGILNLLSTAPVTRYSHP